jgi:hypothetical protein
MFFGELNKAKNKMDKKNLVVTLCTFALAVFLVASVSATGLASNAQVTVNDIQVQSFNGTTTVTPNNLSVVAGSQITVKVYFTSQVNDTNVYVRATLGGQSTVTQQTPIFDVEQGYKYTEFLTLNVPYDLQNQLSDNLRLQIEINGDNYETTLNNVLLRVQRPAYNVDVESVTTPSTINAGQQFPVEVVLKNVGYNELNDVYVSAAISELGVVQGPKWFGDLVTLDNCSGECNNQNTAVGDLYLTVPYNVKSGVYTLQVLVQNNDVTSTVTRQIVITNSVPDTVLVANPQQTVSPGETATYNVLLVNPTDNVKVYTITTDSSSITPSQSIVAVPAGSSSTITVTGSSDTQGTQTFNLNVYDGSTLVKTVQLQMDVTGSSTSNTVVVLTVVLAIIFLVLLVVLIVLLSKKPEKATEDFGESYY